MKKIIAFLILVFLSVPAIVIADTECAQWWVVKKTVYESGGYTHYEYRGYTGDGPALSHFAFDLCMPADGVQVTWVNGSGVYEINGNEIKFEFTGNNDNMNFLIKISIPGSYMTSVESTAHYKAAGNTGDFVLEIPHCDPLSVNFESAQAILVDDGVEISWNVPIGSGFMSFNLTAEKPTYQYIVDEAMMVVPGMPTYFSTVDNEGDIDTKYIIEGLKNEGKVVRRKIPVTTTSTGVQNNTAPREFSLSQNYPNPFNPTTMISYSLAKSTPVNLAIYNSRGRLVATLVDVTQSAGNYSIAFNATSLPSGIYLYRLATDDNVSTKKMMLVK